MSPKVKVQKSDILSAALQIVRTQGHQALISQMITDAYQGLRQRHEKE